MTFRSAILAKSEIISSWTPAAKKAFCLSSLRLSNGNTATLFSGMAVDMDETARAGTDEVFDPTAPDDVRYRRKKKIPSAVSAITEIVAGKSQPVLTCGGGEAAVTSASGRSEDDTKTFAFSTLAAETDSAECSVTLATNRYPRPGTVTI